MIVLVLIKVTIIDQFLSLNMSQFTHCYSSYVNHILNKSPSKTVYSFSKSQRFPELKKEQYAHQPCQYDTFYQKRQDIYNKYNSNNNKFRGSQDQYLEGSRRRNVDYGTRNQVDKILRKIEREHKVKSKSKSPARYKKSTYQSEIRALQARQLNKSPSRKSPKNYYQEPKSPSTGKMRKKNLNISPNKTYTQGLQQLDHPSKNMTITGYYPVGVEISPTGKYASSKIKNITGPKFGNSPSKTKQFDKDYESLGPGYYDSFSEFGPKHRIK